MAGPGTRLAITAWLALTWSAVASVVLGEAVLVVPGARVSAGLAGLLAACAHALRVHYAHPGGAVLAAAGALLALTVTARLAWCTIGTLAAPAIATLTDTCCTPPVAAAMSCTHPGTCPSGDC